MLTSTEEQPSKDAKKAARRGMGRGGGSAEARLKWKRGGAWGHGRDRLWMGYAGATATVRRIG